MCMYPEKFKNEKTKLYEYPALLIGGILMIGFLISGLFRKLFY